jgi:triosephosphate isomerase
MTIDKPFFGGNWKMHNGPTATREFVDAFVDLYAATEDRTVVFFPPTLSLAAFKAASTARPDLLLGVQDVYWEASGAFTGSISAALAREAGASFSLAGHSERRHVFGDSDDDVSRKVNAISLAGLTPILCVGELLEERDRGAVEDVVSRQLEAGLEHLDDERVSAVVIAYEPVWAIGTGRTASAADANEVHTLIRALLGERLGGDAARAIPIIYGGSVKPENVDELLAAPQIDGALVGGASLKPADFARICQAG